MTAREFWIVRLITGMAGFGLQLVGIYAAYVTFGAWITLARYAVGVLALLLQQVVVRRVTSLSAGD